MSSSSFLSFLFLLHLHLFHMCIEILIFLFHFSRFVLIYCSSPFIHYILDFWLLSFTLPSRLEDHLGLSPSASDTLLEPDCVKSFDMPFSMFAYEHLQVIVAVFVTDKVDRPWVTIDSLGHLLLHYAGSCWGPNHLPLQRGSNYRIRDLVLSHWAEWLWCCIIFIIGYRIFMIIGVIAVIIPAVITLITNGIFTYSSVALLSI